ncbi:MAG: xanthine dehydrogenase family protein subunit M [Alphaproteobacteria bacterium]|nr:xanthine dehydrogenase family protein subunit M [Alphaproteobacteria bacterium]
MHATFDLDRPANLAAAFALLKSEGAAALAGGTNLIVDMRAGRERPQRVVSLDRLEALRGIRQTGGQVSIGGRTTVTDLLLSPVIAKTAPALVESARLFAGQMVRNTATVAGNIACGSPAADLVPPLFALDAKLTLVSARGRRTRPIDSFFTGYKTDIRRPTELISRISWKAPTSRSCALFYKLARRKGDAITVVGVAVALDVDRGLCTRARVALGAVAPTVIHAREAEAILEGRPLTPELIDSAAESASAAARPIDDIRASAAYRRHGVRVLVRRLVTQAWERLA